MMSVATLPRILDDLVKNELAPDEQVLWLEQPVPRFMTPAATGAFLFAIPWTAFTLIFIFGASGFKLPDPGNGGEIAFFLFGIPFLLIGLGMLSAPLWAFRRALKTVYVITDRRAITFEGGRTTTIRSYSPERLQNLFRKEQANGIGDVIITQKIQSDSEGGHHMEDLGFLRIRNPKAVEMLLKQLAQQRKQAATIETVTSGD